MKSNQPIVDTYDPDENEGPPAWFGVFVLVIPVALLLTGFFVGLNNFERGSMAQKEVELKGCPFCGVVPEIRESTMRRGIWQIACNNHDCPTPRIFQQSKENAIRMWNTRFNEFP